MVDPALVKEWIEKADEDCRFAEVNLREGRDFYPQICFHFQQAAEKYLKAVIVGYELEFRKTHDLGRLLEICMIKDPSFERIREDCEFLDGFYVDTRYPAHWPAHYTQEVGRKAREAARRVRELVTGVLADFLREK